MSSSNVERIKERLDIVDVIGSYVDLKKAGRNYKAKSPFTNENTPSFYVSPERQLYYCFSSGKGGDMFTFVQDIEGTDFTGALKVLADRAGITLEKENVQARTERDRLYGVVEKATHFFEAELTKDADAQVYVEKRGITQKTVHEWRLGYAPNDWRVLREYLKQGGVTDADMKRVGLIKETEGGKEPYDTFRDRLMFPIFDSSGRVVGFSGRILHPNEKAPKYLNSPDTELFNKSDILYGLHEAKTHIRRKDYAILVEGQMDLVLSHQAGIPNTVASSGTAITTGHLKKLQKISNRIVISFDSDDAGFRAANKTATLALELGMEVKVVKLPEGKDPADIILDSPDTWKELLKNTEHIIDFYLGKLLEQKGDKREVAKQVTQHVLPYVALLGSEVEKSHFVGVIARKTGFNEDALWNDLQKVKAGTVTSEGREELEAVLSPETPEDRIAAIYHWQKNMKEPLVDPKVIAENIERVAGPDVTERIIQRNPETMNKALFEIEAKYATKEVLEHELEKELYTRLEIQVLQENNEELEPQRKEGDEKAITQVFENKKKIEALQLQLRG